jgi:glycosyltransferase involved in cell wall biosynthesis
VLQTKPDNVTFTGFLPDQDYLELLRGADAIMALTSEDFTLQLGGMEAVAVGKPLITSDWSFLREHFDRGTVHVANTPQSIRQGIVEVQENLERLSAEILDLRSAHREEWEAKSKQLHELVKRGTER